MGVSLEFSYTVEFFLNYQQQKFDISVTLFFPFISIVKFITDTHTFDGKGNFIFWLIIMY